MPSEYKSYAYDNPLLFTPVKRILKPGEKITGSLAPQYGNWDQSFESRYTYTLIHRIYESVEINNLRLSTTTIPVTREIVVASGAIIGSGLTIDTRGMTPGEYHLKIAPKSE